MDDPILSVIVCTFNNVRLLPSCLDSLASQTIAKYKYEVIIVNNNSTDSTQQVAQEYIKKYKNYCLVNETRQGLSHSRNKGWKTAKGRYIAFIDDDAKASKNWCQKIIDAFETVSPKPDVVGGSIYPWYELSPPSWFDNNYETRSWGTKSHFLTLEKKKYGFSGSNMAIAIKLFLKFGGFSTKFGIIGKKLRLGDDTEFFHRIHKEKVNLWYDPKIKVYHWTPIYKMTFWYRVKRFYQAGKDLSLIVHKTNSIPLCLKKWAEFVKLMLKIPYYVIKSRKKGRSFDIMLIGQISFHIGSLIEITRLK